MGCTYILRDTWTVLEGDAVYEMYKRGMRCTVLDVSCMRAIRSLHAYLWGM